MRDINRADKGFEPSSEASLRYLAGDYQVLKPGTHVVCAVTRQVILLEDLRYWSEEHQEAYVDAQTALQRLGPRK